MQGDGKAQYRSCQRCGLAPQMDGSRTCYYCDYESKGALRPDGPRRKCPICSQVMQLSSSADGRVVLVSSCGASFDPQTARLSFPSCERVGKGVVGTNQRIRNDAKKIIEERRAAERVERLKSRPEREAARAEFRRVEAAFEAAKTEWRVRRELDQDVREPAVLQMLVECVTDEELQKRALVRLFEIEALEELVAIAGSKSRWAGQAEIAVRRLRTPGIGSE